MNEYRIWHPLWMSFYSRDLYQEVGYSWRGIGFLYLLFLVAVTWVPVMIQLQLDFTAYTADVGEKIIPQLPAIAVKGGEASIDVDMPFEIRDPQTDELLVVIDTRAANKSVGRRGARFMVTKTQLITRLSRGRTHTTDFDWIPDFEFTQEKAQRWWDGISPWVAVVIYPFAVLSSAVYRLILVLLYGVGGLIIAKITKTELGYPALVRLSAIAITPVVILQTVVYMLEINLKMQWLISLTITLAYLLLGVWSNAKPSAPAGRIGVKPGM